MVTAGTLTFSRGESSKTIAVAVLDDAHDEGEKKTFTLTLSVGGLLEHPARGRAAGFTAVPARGRRGYGHRQAGRGSPAATPVGR